MPEPFLVVGLIAATRRILIVTAQLAVFVEKSNTDEDAFRHAMWELGILTVMVVALASLLMLRKRTELARAGGGSGPRISRVLVRERWPERAIFRKDTCGVTPPSRGVRNTAQPATRFVDPVEGESHEELPVSRPRGFRRSERPGGGAGPTPRERRPRSHRVRERPVGGAVADPIAHDGRKFGVVVHHVGNMYPLEISSLRRSPAASPSWA